MALDAKVEAALCLHRFGLGPRAGSIAAIASDPRGALMAEINAPNAGHINDASLLTSAEGARAAFRFRQERRALRQAERAAREGSEEKARNAGAAPMSREPEAAPPNARPNPGPGVPQRLYLDEARARVHAALEAKIGFTERLVWFWSNHFCVSA